MTKAVQAKPTTALRPAEAGRRGDDVRSDCWVRIVPQSTGGIVLELRSKVESLYGDSIRKLVADTLAALGVCDATVELDDAGALPWVLMARVEAAVRRARHASADHTQESAAQTKASAEPLEGPERHAADIGVECLPDSGPNTSYATSADRYRRSRLYLPGNEPKFILNAGLHGPDAIILDLEDSVAPCEKDAARVLVRNALRSVDFRGSERMVRINQVPLGLADLDFIVPHNVHVILIPKVEAPEHVQAVDARIAEISSDQSKTQNPKSEIRNRKSQIANRKSRILLMPIIESALGVIRAYEIATASPNVCALTIGLEDYTADIGAQRTHDGRESFWARSQVVNAARAAGVQPIDSVYADIADMEGLRSSVLEAKSLGFDGKGCIHPRQIRVVHEAFAPTADELEQARRIVAAFEQAQARGLAAVALGSKMIDPPVVKRALRVVKLAEALESQ